MSIERADLRGRCSPEHKSALQAICDARGISEADFIEAVVCRAIEYIVHDAQSIADKSPRLGISAGKWDGLERAGK